MARLEYHNVSAANDSGRINEGSKRKSAAARFWGRIKEGFKSSYMKAGLLFSLSLASSSCFESSGMLLTDGPKGKQDTVASDGIKKDSGLDGNKDTRFAEGIGADLAPSWWDKSWKTRAACSVNTTVSSSLKDFPAHCLLDTATLISSSKMDSNCKDIRVMAPDNITQLSYEIESGTCNTANTVIWFKIPLTSGAQDYKAWIYYGNSLASDAQNIKDVWTEFSDVWHLSEASGNTFFSSTGLNDLSLSGSVTRLSGSKCKFGGCISTGSGMLSVSSTTYQSLADLTVRCWVYQTDKSGYQTIIAQRDSNLHWSLYTHTNIGELSFHGTSQYPSYTTLTLNAWVHALARVSSSSTSEVFKDGTKIYGPSQYSYGAVASVLTLSGYSGSERFQGTMDECRISKSAISDDWLKAELSQTHALGSEENSP